jgi:hypothetical protein
LKRDNSVELERDVRTNVKDYLQFNKEDEMMRKNAKVYNHDIFEDTYQMEDLEKEYGQEPSGLKNEAQTAHEHRNFLKKYREELKNEY